MYPNLTLKQISEQLGLTERTLYNIIKDLAGADMVRVQRVGRRNLYTLNPDARFIHPPFSHLSLGSVLDALKPPGHGRIA